MTAIASYNFSEVEDTLGNDILLVCTRRHVNPNVGAFYGDNPLKYSFPLLLMEVIMVVVITQLIRIILKPLKQPKVVCEILGGIIVGRSAIGGNNRFGRYLFPQDALFILKNLGFLGFMYFLFLAGVKTDVRLMRRAGRKQWIIAVISVLAPMICTVSLAISMRKNLDEKVFQVPTIFGITALFSVTAFPVLNPIIKELNLLSSEIGRLAVSITLITVVIGVMFSVIFEAGHQGSINGLSALWSVMSFFLFTASIFGGFRQAMFWLVRSTPQGKPIAEVYVIAILIVVLISGFFADAFGMALYNGPMWLGLAIPDGPPLGATLVERTETIVNNFLMPFAYIFVGLITDLSAMADHWSTMQPYFYFALTAVSVKLIATFLISYLVKLPPKECLALSLLMCLRGQLEFLLLIRFTDLGVITSPTCAMLVLIILVSDAISTPLIGFLHNPRRPYMVNKRRTIQHTHPNSELRIVACFFDDRSVVAAINLLELSNSSMGAPICIYALHLVELIAQANPLLIEHNNEEMDSEDTVHKALKRFRDSRRQDFELHHFTIMTAKRTMYQDICELALLKKASLIIIPFNQELAVVSTATETNHLSIRQVSIDVLEQAPCSVAIFSNTSMSENNLLNLSKNHSSHHVTVIFLGGADSREALIYADRISLNLNVCLTVIRFLSRDERGDDKLERKLDDGLITAFWVKHEANSRVIYREVVVEHGEDTISAIQGLTSDECDLFIVGRKHGINPVIIQGLSDWSEHSELGAVGDYIASSELGRRTSVLVMQQQILRG